VVCVKQSGNVPQHQYTWVQSEVGVVKSHFESTSRPTCKWHWHLSQPALEMRLRATLCLPHTWAKKRERKRQSPECKCVAGTLSRLVCMRAHIDPPSIERRHTAMVRRSLAVIRLQQREGIYFFCNDCTMTRIISSWWPYDTYRYTATLLHKNLGVRYIFGPYTMPLIAT